MLEQKYQLAGAADEARRRGEEEAAAKLKVEVRACVCEREREIYRERASVCACVPASLLGTRHGQLCPRLWYSCIGVPRS